MLRPFTGATVMLLDITVQALFLAFVGVVAYGHVLLLQAALFTKRADVEVARANRLRQDADNVVSKPIASEDSDVSS